MPRALRSVALALALAASPAAPLRAGAAASSPEAPTLETLMAGMAGTSGVSARFVETKQVSLLSAPIETRGSLVFVPPDRLWRSTSEPSETELVIAGPRFSFHDAAGGDRLDLSASPLAREFVESFIVLFNGDLARLRERYGVEFHAHGDAWSLTLRPRRHPLADLIERITLAGSGRSLSQMEMLEKDGDRTTTRFSEVEVDRRFTRDELDRLFEPPANDARAP